MIDTSDFEPVDAKAIVPEVASAEPSSPSRWPYVALAGLGILVLAALTLAFRRRMRGRALETSPGPM